MNEEGPKSASTSSYFEPLLMKSAPHVDWCHESVRCVGVQLSKNLAVLSHIPYQNFGTPDPKKKKGWGRVFPSENQSCRAPWPILFLHGRSAHGVNSIQHMIHECTDTRSVDVSLFVNEWRCRPSSHDASVRRVSVMVSLLSNTTDLQPIQGTWSLVEASFLFRCSYDCPQSHQSPPWKLINSASRLLNWCRALGVAAP